MDANAVNEQTVDRLIAEGALWTPRVIAAFRATPRHRFLDRVFYFHRRRQQWKEVVTRDGGPRELALVYADRAWITHLRQDPKVPGHMIPMSSASQPSLMSRMIEELQLQLGHRTLEIGAGTGYNAALLAHIVGPGRVTSVEVDRDVLSEAWDHLRAFPDRQVQLREGDGRLGWPGDAPFDRIMVTAATPDLEPAWLEQTARGGLVQAPMEVAPGLAYLVQGSVTDGVFQGNLTRPAYFLSLRGAESAAAVDPASGSLGDEWRAHPAPWRDWLAHRTSRVRWLSLVQSLAFFGWLHGLPVHYTSGDDGPMFALSWGEQVCWFSPRDWRCHGAEAHSMAWSHWRSFLDAGGPWPSEFRLTASADAARLSAPPHAFRRQGPRCAQAWELPPDRVRPALF